MESILKKVRKRLRINIRLTVDFLLYKIDKTKRIDHKISVEMKSEIQVAMVI